MLNYGDFCKGSSEEWKNNGGAKAVFDFLSAPENIHSMIIMSELGLPAISGIVGEVEKRFENIAGFPMSVPTNRQTVGRMVKFILDHFGYEPTVGGLDEKAQMRNFTGAKLFKTSSIYKKTKAAVNSLKIEIV